MSCNRCGNKLPPKAKFCSSCGAPATSSVQPKTDDFSSRDFMSEKKSGASEFDRIPLVEGEKLMGRFEIKRELGLGGFGTVFLAEDCELKKDVALKVASVIPGQSEVAAESIRRELLSRDRINDFKHVIRTYDIHTAEHNGLSLLLLPMEYANSGNLRRWLIKHSQNPDQLGAEKIDFFKQACLGVKAIHDAGLVHLDLKPENLLLCSNKKGQTIVKISDFGLSMKIEHYTMTEYPAYTQRRIGTPAYMSPEQFTAARQKDVGTQSDIYSLGVILFEIMDNDPPFDGSWEELKEKHIKTSPPELRGVDENIAEVVKHCLEKKPSNRFGRVEDLLQALSGTEKQVKKMEIEEKKANASINQAIYWMEKHLLSADSEVKDEIDKITQELARIK